MSLNSKIEDQKGQIDTTNILLEAFLTTASKKKKKRMKTSRRAIPELPQSQENITQCV
jgi:hypothetical protein